MREIIQKSKDLVLFRVLVLIVISQGTNAALPCNEVHKYLSIPCKCDVKPTDVLPQGVGLIVNCDNIVFPGDLPQLPQKAPILEFRQRYSGHQNLPTKIFSRSELPLQNIDFSHNALRRLSDRLFASIADTIEEINLSYNLLGDNLNPIFATTEFQNLNNLKRLDLSGNQIRGLEEGIFRGCTNLQNLQLDKNMMSEIPGQSLKGPKALSELSLAQNRIKTIKQSDFSTQKDLKKLNLRENELTSIERETFLGMRNLREILLSRNSLSRFNSDVFIGAENLETLDLSENYFTEFPYITLKSVSRLKYLNLSSNLIKTLANANIGSLSNLESLDLSRNNIASIQPGTFLGLKKLRQLDLSVNSLRTIEDDAFEGLDNLEKLLLTDNNILLIPSSALGRLPKLVYLDISYNRISAISREILQSIDGKLTYLNLGRNVIREIPEGTFQDLIHLKILNLNGNLLTRVNGDTFQGLEDTLEFLHLGQNKISGFSGALLILPKLVYLDLFGNAFTDIPLVMFTELTNLRHLNLSHNSFLESLDNSFFHSFPLLSSLDISHCGINSIHPELFLRSGNLVSLILSGNDLESVSDSSFKNLKNLTYLDLGDNNIFNIKAGSFGNNYNLRTLLLNGNRLNAFKGEYFRGGRNEYRNSTNLEFLNIANNEISYLFPSSFKIHKRLRALTAHDNKLKSFPADLTANLQFLEKIDLSNNQLKAIEEMDFSRLPRLRELNVKGNEIEHVSESAFHNSTQLQNIDLSENQIDRIGERTFEGLLRLENLNLHDNRLEDLPETIFDRSKLQMLENIDLSKNKFTDPPLKPLHKQSSSLNSVNLAHNSIKDIPSEDITIANVKKLDLSFNPLTEDSIGNILGEPKTVRELSLAGVGMGEIKQIQMPFLHKLNLSHNDISEISSKVFERSTLLEHLDVSNNKIKNFSDVQVWPRVRSIRSLDISGNPIEEILTDHFSNLSTLKTLNMHDLLQVKKIEKNAFKPLGNLKELRAFNYPFLGYLDVPGILNYLPVLEDLEIEMKDSSVPSEKLAPVMHPRLKNLGLHGKQIESISSGAFAGLKAPKINLKLANTSVSSLPQGLFLPLPKSSEINLDVFQSNISSLTPQFIAMLEDNPNHINLKGLDTNPIVCDCNSKHLKKWLHSNKIIDIKCNNGELQGVSLRDLDEEKLICNEKSTTKQHEPQSPTTTSTVTTTTYRNTPIITKSYRRPTTESDVIWSYSPKTRKTTHKPPKVITANAGSLNNDDVLIIGIVGGVVVFIVILIIVICIIRFRMGSNQNPIATPYAPSNAWFDAPPPSIYMAPTYATLPHKVVASSVDASSLKHYSTMRPPTQMQSYHNTLQNQSPYYIPYTPDDKIEYR